MKKVTSKLGILAMIMLAGLFFTNIAFGQNKVLTDRSDLSQRNATSVEEFKEGKYLVKIINNQDGTFGYEINLDGKQIVSVTDKKYFSIPMGYNDKENAKIIAKWQVNRIEKFNEIDSQLSLEQAKSLGVTQNDLELSFKHNK